MSTLLWQRITHDFAKLRLVFKTPSGLPRDDSDKFLGLADS